MKAFVMSVIILAVISGVAAFGLTSLQVSARENSAHSTNVRL